MRVGGFFVVGGVAVKTTLAIRVLWDEPLRTADAISAKFTSSAAIGSDWAPVWRWQLATCTFDRFARDVATAVRVAFIYGKASFSKPTSAEGVPESGWAPAVHTEGALAFLALAQANGGIYVKAAQHLAQLDYMLPHEYAEVLGVMTHAAPRDSWPLAARIFAEEVGLPIEGQSSPFSEIDHTPLASASLAQVHIARLRSSGEKVAVKIQHGGLRETAAADIATVRALTRFAAWAFPSFDLAWLADEVAQNLPRELDFQMERANMERASTLWYDEKDIAIAIPRPIPALCRSRILTMTFEEGCYANDVAAIKKSRLVPAQVATLTTRIFSRAVFSHGFAHCDPHAANILVRPRAPRTWVEHAWAWVGGAPTPEIVLLDHGLYRDLSPQLRRSYAAMWAALTRGDAAGMQRAGEELGCGGEGDGGGAFALLASMLAARSYDRILAVGAASGSVRGLAESGSVQERAVLANNARTYARGIERVLRKLPRDLLVVLKLNDCLRAVELALGVPGHNFGEVAREAQISEAREARRRGGGWGCSRGRCTWLLIELHWSFALLAWVTGFGGRREGRR